MRSWTVAPSLGLAAGCLIGLVRAAEAVSGHGLLAAGLGRLWRALVRAELLPSALVGLAAGLAVLALWALVGALGVPRPVRAAAARCLALLALGVGALSCVLRGRAPWSAAGPRPAGLARTLAEGPAWALPLARVVGILLVLSLALWLARWLYPRLVVRARRERPAREHGAGERALASAAATWIGALLLAGLVGLELWYRLDRAATSAGPNLVLVTVDTLRADHLGCYGYERPTSPAIDRLAAGGVRFERAVSQAPWTLPAMASLHTGLYPSQHGADRGNRRLAPARTTLAEVLRDGGYHTLGVVSHLFVSDRFGFRQGFERFDEQAILGHEGVSSRLLTRTALELLGPNPPEPFFLWVHYFDPHYTYVHHPEQELADPASAGLADRVSFEFLEAEGASLTEAQVAQVVALYDEEIAHTDASVGALLEGLAALPLERETVTAFAADHGELFRERGRFGHGREVYGELIDVPLILSGPSSLLGPARAVAAPAETSWLPRTLSRLAGLDPARFGGHDLLETSPAAVAYFEGGYASGDDSRKLGALAPDGWKLIDDLDRGTRELYHLPSDPRELHDRLEDPAAAEPRARLTALLAELGRSLPGLAGGEVELDLEAAEVEHLRELGYVE